MDFIASPARSGGRYLMTVGNGVTDVDGMGLEPEVKGVGGT